MAERWERQEKTNQQANQNFAELNANLSRLTETLARMEATINNLGPNQRTNPTARDDFASTFGGFREERQNNPVEPGENRTIGYRGIHNVLENRINMLKRIELPQFSGSSPYTWINQAERFFKLGNYNDAERLEILFITLQGPALNWFNREMNRDPFRDWKGSVVDYVNEFEELTTIVMGVEEENLEHVFDLGLKPEMQEVVKMQKPWGLSALFSTIISMEDSHFCKSMAEIANPTKRSGSYFPLRSASIFNTQRNDSPTQSSDSLKGGSKSSEPSQNSKPPWKNNGGRNYSGILKLSPAEIAEKWRLGLCYKCPEKWTRGHQCHNMMLQVFTVINEEEVEITDEDWIAGIEEYMEMMRDLIELSLFSFLGLESPSATKLWGTIGKTKVIVMIDSGTTHNFIDPSVLGKTSLAPAKNRKFDLLLGTGITVNGSGLCKDVSLTL
ncbi:unnamed protein product [Microthlaspi erraticum]|uniref:Retrotransposon gag domain-containing protein n=1 Tax=Microthlaspi erraticum TaxID=1685480 RepID=A0A6D2LDX0_9BRAS|nr:unnamed protein product [Microthlaspi erraticum]CAA7062546.1 unnamed protein product [Microthlaspi erraticum]